MVADLANVAAKILPAPNSVKLGFVRPAAWV